MYKKIAVEDLQFGKYVAELDRPWTDTPFLFQGFVLTSDEQLETLRRFCKFVYVDPDRDEGAEEPRGPGPKLHIRGTTEYRELASVEAELPHADVAYQKMASVLGHAVSLMQKGQVIEGPRVRDAVSQLTDSVVRNPDAMTLLTKLRDKGALDVALESSIYMIVFARFLQLPRERLELMGLVGLLQNVGMVMLPPGLVDREGSLSPEEMEIVKTHVRHTVEILSATPGLPDDLPGIASLHHERLDGSGYPRGLRKSQAIGLYGGIAGIVDTFTALTSPRPHAERQPPSAALNVLYKGRGTLFEPALVEQFIQCIGVFPVGGIVELNTGEIAIVVAQNPVRRLQPRVMVVQDAKGDPVTPHKLLDLEKSPTARRGEPYRIRRTLEFESVRIDPREFFL
jgi:HD-GYP domain-containing protein (c-di-GMP phosphodiesterase class II)